MLTSQQAHVSIHEHNLQIFRVLLSSRLESFSSVIYWIFLQPTENQSTTRQIIFCTLKQHLADSNEPLKMITKLCAMAIESNHRMICFSLRDANKYKRTVKINEWIALEERIKLKCAREREREMRWLKNKFFVNAKINETQLVGVGGASNTARETYGYIGVLKMRYESTITAE